MIVAATTGFLTALSLILAIGAQNAFVLRQGLLRAHVFWLCLLCAVSDAILITVGVLGFSSLVSLYPLFPAIMALAGAAFLLSYGTLRLRAAWIGVYHLKLEGDRSTLRNTLLVGLAITWLNPHVYLDTLGLIGAVSTQFHDAGEKVAFTIAATAASFVFFFSLGYGARYLAPVMRSARAWQILDTLIGLVMLGLAAGLIRSTL